MEGRDWGDLKKKTWSAVNPGGAGGPGFQAWFSPQTDFFFFFGCFFLVLLNEGKKSGGFPRGDFRKNLGLSPLYWGKRFGGPGGLSANGGQWAFFPTLARRFFLPCNFSPPPPPIWGGGGNKIFKKTVSPSRWKGGGGGQRPNGKRRFPGTFFSGKLFAEICFPPQKKKGGGNCTAKPKNKTEFRGTPKTGSKNQNTKTRETLVFFFRF